MARRIRRTDDAIEALGQAAEAATGQVEVMTKTIERFVRTIGGSDFLRDLEKQRKASRKLAESVSKTSESLDMLAERSQSFSEEVTQLEKDLAALRKESSSSGKTFKKLRVKTAAFFETTSDVFGRLGRSVNDYEKPLRGFLDASSDLVGRIPLVGGVLAFALEHLAGTVLDTADTFSEFAQRAAVPANRSLSRFTMVVDQTFYSWADLQRLINENASSLSRLKFAIDDTVPTMRGIDAFGMTIGALNRTMTRFNADIAKMVTAGAGLDDVVRSFGSRASQNLRYMGQTFGLTNAEVEALGETTARLTALFARMGMTFGDARDTLLDTVDVLVGLGFAEYDLLADRGNLMASVIDNVARTANLFGRSVGDVVREMRRQVESMTAFRMAAARVPIELREFVLALQDVPGGEEIARMIARASLGLPAAVEGSEAVLLQTVPEFQAILERIRGAAVAPTPRARADAMAQVIEDMRRLLPDAVNRAVARDAYRPLAMAGILGQAEGDELLASVNALRQLALEIEKRFEERGMPGEGAPGRIDFSALEQAQGRLRQTIRQINDHFALLLQPTLVSAIDKFNAALLYVDKALDRLLKEPVLDVLRDELSKGIRYLVDRVWDLIDRAIAMAGPMARDLIDKAKAKLHELWERIKNIVTSIKAGIVRILEKIKDAIVRAWESIVETVEDWLDSIAYTIRSTKQSVLQTIADVRKAFAAPLHWIEAMFRPGDAGRSATPGGARHVTSTILAGITGVAEKIGDALTAATREIFGIHTAYAAEMEEKLLHEQLDSLEKHAAIVDRTHEMLHEEANQIAKTVDATTRAARDVAAASEAAGRRSGELARETAGLGSTVRTIVADIVGYVRSLLSSLSDAVGGFATSAKDMTVAAAGLPGLLGDALDGTVDAVENALSGLAGGVRSLTEGWMRGLSDAFESARAALTGDDGAIGAIRAAVRRVPEFLRNALARIVAVVEGTATSLADAFIAPLDAVRGIVERSLDGTADLLSTAVTGGIAGIVDAARESFLDFGAGVRDAIRDVVERGKGGGIPAALRTSADVIVTGTQEAVERVAEDVLGAIRSFGGFLSDAFASVHETARAGAKAIESVLHDTLAMLPEGIRGTIAAVVRSATRNLGELAQGVAAAVASVRDVAGGRDTADVIAERLAAVRDVLRTGIARYMEAVGTVADHLRGAIDTLAGDLALSARNTFASFAESIVGKLSEGLASVDPEGRIARTVADVAGSVGERMRASMEHLARNTVSMLVSSAEAIGNVISEGLASIDPEGRIARTAATASKAVLDALRTFSGGFVSAISGAFASLAGNEGEAARVVSEIVHEGVENLRAGIVRLVDLVRGAVAALAEGVGSVVDFVGSIDPRAMFETAFGAVKEAASGAAKKLGDASSAVLDRLRSLLTFGGEDPERVPDERRLRATETRTAKDILTLAAAAREASAGLGDLAQRVRTWWEGIPSADTIRRELEAMSLLVRPVDGGDGTARAVAEARDAALLPDRQPAVARTPRRETAVSPPSPRSTEKIERLLGLLTSRIDEMLRIQNEQLRAVREIGKIDETSVRWARHDQRRLRRTIEDRMVGAP